MTRLIQFAAWLALIAVAVATLSPVGLRPRLATADVSFEHIGAYALIGLLFALAYPRQAWLAAFLVLLTAFGLEAWQMLTPDLHARLVDAAQKAGGGLLGLSLGWLAVQFRRWLHRQATS